MQIAWGELFAVFVVFHLAGDFILQTEFQAVHKHHGLGPDPVKRRALAMHTATYTLCFLPAVVWLAGDVEAWALPASPASTASPTVVRGGSGCAPGVGEWATSTATSVLASARVRSHTWSRTRSRTRAPLGCFVVR